MPEVGEIATAKKLGRNGGRKYIWSRCPDCTVERWTVLKPLDTTLSRRCADCVRIVAKRAFKLSPASE